jgi:TP901 family phage tail tape measure protein
MEDLELALKFIANSRPLTTAYDQAQSRTHQFAASVKKDFEGIKKVWGSATAKLGALGMGFGGYKIIQESAQLDKQLTRIRQTAGATAENAKTLRTELFGMSQVTGAGVTDLANGFESLIASGQSWGQARETISAINKAMAVSGANAQTLSNGLTTAGAAFQFDLSKPGLALELLDKMTKAGRLGNAELENLSDIFARVGVNANSAGLSFDKTLAFIETLSLVEKAPERLATLADSTLRIFTNLQYMQQVQKKAGIQFFDAQGQRRDAMVVFADIKKKYDALGTEAAKSKFLGTVFKGVDLDAIRGLRMLFTGDTLAKGSRLATEISTASGTLNRDLSSAIDNSVDQVSRLRNALQEAADGFAKKLNKASSKGISHLLDNVGMSGTDITVAGIAATVAAYMAGKGIKGVVGKWMRGGASTVAGIGEGKAIEAATGVQPVFVVNFPEGGGIASPSGLPVSGVPAAGGGATAAAVAGLALPAAAIALTAGGIYGAYRINQKNISTRLAEQQYDKRATSDLVDSQSGRVYRPAMTTAADAQAIGTGAPKVQTNVTVYVDNEKKKPTKTLSLYRGDLQ